MHSKPRLRDALAAVSIANLCLLEAWTDLLPSAIEPQNFFYLTHFPAAGAYWAALCWLLILAAGTYAMLRWVRERPGREGTGAWLLLLLALFPLQTLMDLQGISYFRIIRWFGRNPFLAEAIVASLACLGLTGLLVLLRRFPAQIFRVLTAILLFLSPFAALTAAQSLWVVVRRSHYEARLAPGEPAPRLSGKDGGHIRVVWALFDALGHDAAYSDKADSAALREFARLRDTSVIVANATSPSRATIRSVPSMLTARRIKEEEISGPSDMDVKLESAGGLEPAALSELPNIFRRARALGLDTAVAGWYIPYCRIFSRDLTECSSVPYAHDPLSETAFPQALASMARRQVNLLPAARRWLPLDWLYYGTFPGFGLRTHRYWNSRDVKESHLRAYQKVLASAEKLATDPDLEVVFIHFPIPHQPFIYSKEHNDFKLDGMSTYAGNVLLVDRTLTALRESMERAGTWSRTALVISGDHAVNSDHALLLIHAPGQTTGAVRTEPFEMLHLSDLLLDLAGRPMMSPSEIANWRAREDNHAP